MVYIIRSVTGNDRRIGKKISMLLSMENRASFAVATGAVFESFADGIACDKIISYLLLRILG